MSREQRIYDALSLDLKPDYLSIDNESGRHNVPAGSETHFKIIAVSPIFEHQGRVARHRLLNTLLAKEFTLGLHALSLHLYTPEEWAKKRVHVPASPACQNGKH